LYHETLDNTVKHVAVVITVAAVNAEILHGLRASATNKKADFKSLL